MSKFCIHCGSEIKEGDKFCTACGKSVEEQTSGKIPADI